MASDALGTGIVEILGDATSLNSLISNLKKSVPTQLQFIADASSKSFLVAAAAATAVAVGVFEVTRRTAEYADAMGKASERTGIGIEALAGLRLAAELNDVSFEGLQTSLKIFSKHVTGDLATGLAQTAERFRNIKDPVEKGKLAMELFGRQGLLMIKPLEEDLAGLTQTAKKLGIAVGPELAKEGDRLGDNLKLIQEVARGLALTFGEKLVPFAADLAEKFLKWYEVNAELLKQDVVTFALALKEAIKGVATYAEQLGPWILKISSALATTATEAVGIGEKLKIVNQAAVDVFAQAWDAATGKVKSSYDTMHAEGVKYTDLTVTRAKNMYEALNGETKKNAIVQTDAEKTLADALAASAKKLTEDLFAENVKRAEDERKAGVKRQEGLDKWFTEMADKDRRYIADEQERRFQNFLKQDEWVTTFNARRNQSDQERFEAAMRRLRGEQEKDLATWQSKMQNAVQFLSMIGGALSTFAANQDIHNKKDFEKNKKLKLASTIVNTSAAIMMVWASSPNFWVGLAQSIIIAAIGTMNLMKIQKEKYQGSASGGVDMIPEDQSMFVHRGEMIVPANPAEKIRGFADALAEGGANRGTTKDGLQVTFAYKGGDRSLTMALLRSLNIEVRDYDGRLIATDIKGEAGGI